MGLPSTYYRILQILNACLLNHVLYEIWNSYGNETLCESAKPLSMVASGVKGYAVKSS